MEKVIQMIETAPTESDAKQMLEVMKIFLSTKEYKKAQKLIKKEFNDD